MFRANNKKAARRSAGQHERDAHANAPRRKSGLVTVIQAEIWHRRYPPASVLQALATACGRPMTAADIRVFTGLGITLAARGWSFIRECSGPEVLTFSYQPSDAGLAYLHHGLEPVTTVVVTLDRSLPADTVAGCEVEVLLVGAPRRQARLTDLPGLTTYLRVIQAYRPGEAIPVPFPLVVPG
ncbi:hypothetical protein GFY24_34265 [Nocardia sp. SYP-A9097]|uniref:hypothetical protein n=1 Tax=Nocardia sp. SYP-A9097 TaxID=2663237 RepID=UPI00129B5BB0|nr:hypothetical protein [Nocardia sp. SYP-A9097]MRH92431.1 hypothetical protein [Nocardia sp. SYP-A9097]